MKRTVVELHSIALATALILGACSTGRPYQPQDGGSDAVSSGSGGGAGKGAGGATGGAGGHAGGGAGGHAGTGGAAGTGVATDGGASDAAKGPGLGHSCSSGTDCGSGFCVQGVCCSSACTDSCYACTNALTGSSPDGTCAVVSQGLADPAGGCSPGSLSSCGNTGHCDGNGACEKFGSSTVCLAASCAGGGFTSSSTCDGKGKCAAGTTTDCKGFTCSATTGCATNCTADADCPAGYCTSTMTCAATTSDGSTCSKNSQCTHANCISGICCAAACTGTCMTCATGLCKPVASGGSSAGACAADTAACGHDGTCDGNGGCRYATTSISCGAVSCSGNQLTPTGLCNGTGTCSTPAATACSGGVICASGTACKSSTCTADADCFGGLCQSGACVAKRPNGQACTATDQCTSGFCANGVCCGSACTGTCQACTNKLTGSSPDGTCAAVSQGVADPAGGCAAGSAASCGNDGHCDGKGACEKYGSSTVCLAASCGSAGYTSPSTCNGMGTCTAGTTTGCKGFTCSATTGCATSCSADTDCPGGYCTSAMTCAATMSDGSTCSKNSQCTHAACISGICCATACAGTCMTCATGLCKPVASGGSSAGGCAVDSTACGHDGTCDGNGGCRFAVSSVSCGTPSCSSAQLTPIGNCNGSGTCTAGTAAACANNLICASGTTCKTSCSADTDCVTTAYCSSGSCLPKKSNGSTCGAPNQCSSTICAPDGICCNRACSNSCEACDNAGSVGTCSPVQSGPVHGNRTGCLGGGTGCAGSCMGLTSGLCSYPTNGCGTASCSGTQFVATGTCNGNGSCAFPAAQNCSGGYVCSASACKTSCTADADCLSGNFCESGICHPTAISIEAGQSTVCVVLSDATARCWGANGSGELGTGAVTSSSATPVKVAVVSGPIKAMSTGSDFNCALLQSGAIWCWGFNGNGQLGNGTTSGTVILSPTSAVLTNLNLGATQLAAGQTSSCALLTDGSVQCWGQNNYGQLGTGSFTLTQSPTPLTVSVGAGTVTQLSVTSGSAFALINSAGQNNLVSWGENNYGELGLDTITSASPAGVPTPSAAYTNIGAIALSDYSYFQCMLSTSGIPTCFGQGYSDLPTSITGWAGAAVQLADGDQTCALLSGSTGVVTCWPAAGSATAVTLPMPATKVVVGYTYACAILKNGSVWCWGDDSLGELGNGNFNSSTTPVQVLGW